MRKDIKKEIIEATIKLIEEKGSNTDDITISEICDRVGIGVGLVNYHFQTKDNLIRQCVRNIISDIINNSEKVFSMIKEDAPKNRLCALLKVNCNFLVENENISRISILTDITNDELCDNTQQTVDAYLPIALKAYAEVFSQEEIKRRLYLLIFSIQSVFMRTVLLKDQTGFDFHNPAHRSHFIEQLINLYFGK